MVIGDLFAVADLGCQDFLWRVQTPDGSGGGDQLRNRAFHIIGQKAAVRSGIGTQFLFIEGLEVIQGLLGGVAQGAIGLPLEGGEIAEGRGLFRLFLPLHCPDGGGA